MMIILVWIISPENSKNEIGHTAWPQKPDSWVAAQLIWIIQWGREIHKSCLLGATYSQIREIYSLPWIFYEERRPIPKFGYTGWCLLTAPLLKILKVGMEILALAGDDKIIWFKYDLNLLKTYQLKVFLSAPMKSLLNPYLISKNWFDCLDWNYQRLICVFPKIISKLSQGGKCLRLF